MTLGQKLKKLRTEKGLTQKDLADQLHVTFQTVSKWEKDENEPDISTLKELSKLYDCSVDYLISDEETMPEEEVKPAEVVPAPVQQQTIIIHQKELHVCARCKKDIPEEELDIDHVPHTERHGRRVTTTYSDAYYHKACLQQKKAEDAAAAKALAARKAQLAKKRSFGWGFGAGGVTLAVALIAMLAAGQNVIHPGLAVLFSVLLGYAAFADLYCILSGSYIGDVFMSVASWSIHFPGLIFSFDIDGFAWFIAMKILFAILGFLFGIAVLALAIALSAALAAISFPFILVHNINNHYADAI